MNDALDGLTTFLAVGRCKSFTAAAAALGVTPTAVSQKIKLLERRYGVVLFQRTTRRVALTEPGASLFQRLQPAIADVEGALAALGDYRGRPSGNLRITAPRMSGASLLAPLVAQMREAYPELSIEVSLDDAFVDLVAAGFDAGIRLGDAVEKDMVRVPITSHSSWSIVGSPAYLERAGRPRAPEDLVHHRAIRQRLIASGAVYRWELERRGKTITVDVPGGVVVDDIALMVALACAGSGLAYVPDQAVERDLSEGRLERVLEAFITKGPGLYLYFPARTQEQPKLRALIETVTSARGQKARRRSGRTGVSGGGVPA
ncbi:MAG TPA: LysR family transcriptional regulator [Sorangium sp.]|nr:LysR family transcriptional regulator [Sorangium sp.]